MRRRFAPHPLRHSHAVEMARERVPPIIIHGSVSNATPRLGLCRRDP
jgi:hypothetical protein